MNEFATLPLGTITPSPTNPRKHFDDASLKDLAASIAASGVHQPVLVRPLPASRVADTADMQPRPTFELVAGERRWRASALAKQTSIPALVRSLTDDQVLEIQIVENLQRQDLTALEEAEGYQTLMDHSGLTADQVGEKIGKSRSYVFGRLKLLDMGQDCRDALRTGMIDASKALLLARIPSTSLQAKALREIIRPNHPEGVMSHKLAHEWIKSRYMLKIEQAIFDHTDASLAPRACTICPTRTGADADLFMDVMGADMCTDPDCYNNKVQQHHSRRRDQLEAQGHKIIDGDDAKAVMPTPNSPPEGYARLDDAADSPTKKTLREELAKLIEKGDVVPVMIVNPHIDGDLIACVPEGDVHRLLERAGRKKAADVAKQEQERRDEFDAATHAQSLRTEYELKWRMRVLQAVFERTQKVPEEGLTTPTMQTLVPMLIGNTDSTSIVTMCDMLGIEAADDDTAGDESPHAVALREWALDMGNGTTAADVLLLLTAAMGLHWHAWYEREEAEMQRELAPLIRAALTTGVPMLNIQNEVREEIRLREVFAKVETAKADLPLAPAAQANGVRGKGKTKQTPAGAAQGQGRLSAQEAEQGIAAAMQSIESAQAPHAGQGTKPGADAPNDEALVRHADQGAAVPQTPTNDTQAKGHQDESIKRSDVLLEDAAELVTEAGHVSVRQLKTALGIGAERAMRIIAQLERDGIVSGLDATGVRKVLVQP